ncbi:MAG: hypothetical protein ACMUJM_22855 [bacterium]
MDREKISKRFLEHNFHDALLKEINVKPAESQRASSIIEVILADYNENEIIYIIFKQPSNVSFTCDIDILLDNASCGNTSHTKVSTNLEYILRIINSQKRQWNLKYDSVPAPKTNFWNARLWLNNLFIIDILLFYRRFLAAISSIMVKNMITKKDIRALSAHKTRLGKISGWVIIILPFFFLIIGVLNLRLAAKIGGYSGYDLKTLSYNWYKGIEVNKQYSGIYLKAMDRFSIAVFDFGTALILSIVVLTLHKTKRMYSRILETLENANIIKF